jgi:hypothetical protein
VRDDTFEISPDLFRWYAKRRHALLPSPKIASFVTRRVVTETVRHSVHLNCNAGRLAEEVEHIRAEWMLSPELQAIGPQTKHSPEPDL